jgi:hypothetical protein
MTIYYVSSISGSDSNAGTATGAPLATLQAAADKTKPGDVVEVMNGTYTNPRGGGAVVSITHSGTAAAPITFEAMPGQHPIIDSSGNWAGILISSASYIDVKGLEVVGDAKSVTLTYAQSQATNTNNPTTAGDGIDIQRSSSSGAIPNHIVIENNIVHDEPGGGIVSMNADYVSVLNNTAFGNANWSPYASSGISVGFSNAIDSTTGYHDFIIGNTVYGNQEYIPFHVAGTITDGNGIIVDSNNLYGYTGRTLVENNVSYNNGGTGIHTFNSDHVDIVYNTGYMNNQSSNLNEGQIVSQNSNDVKLENNIMVAPSGKIVDGYLSGYSVTYDYNIYYGGSSVPTKGAHDVVANPLFVSPSTGNFALQAGSPAIDSANPAFTVATDNQGNARPSGAGYDRGGLELQTGGSPSLAPAPTITSVTPQAVERGQTTPIATVAPGQSGDTLSVVETGSSQGGALQLQLVGGVQEIIYTAPATVAVSTTDNVAYQVKDTNNNTMTTGTASVVLDAGPVITPLAPQAVTQGQATVIGTVAPGKAGDTLTLTETTTTQGGVVRLNLIGGVEQILYTAPASVPATETDTVSYTVRDQHNNATAAATESVTLNPPSSSPAPSPGGSSGSPVIALAVPATTVADFEGNPTPIKGVALSDSLASDVVTLSLSASSGKLAMTDPSGNLLAGSGTSAITVSGSTSQLNAELATLSYTGTADGQATASLAASDAAGAKAQASLSATVSPDTLVLQLSEDYYRGDAKFIVKLDGTQIGGPTAVTARHSSGASEAFTYSGDWGGGLHKVEVDFINDRYAGTSTTDRNLYINQITYDGAPGLSHMMPLYSNGGFVLTVGSTS